MNKKSKSKLGLNAETIKQLGVEEISGVHGGGRCSTNAPTGLCPQTTVCPPPPPA